MMKRVDFKHPEFFAGITSLKYTASGVVPQRLPQAAIDFCTALEDVKGARARGGAGVRLQAHTNTRKLGIKLHVLSKNADNCIMTLIDSTGKCEHRQFTEDTELNWDLPENNDKITLFFPWQAEIEIIDVLISSGAYFHPAIEVSPRKLIFIGDSITQGMESAYPEKSYAALVAQKLGVDFNNCGVGGLKMEPEFVQKSLCGAFDIAFLAFGVNDASLKTPLPLFAENCRRSLEILTGSMVKKIFMLLPLYWPDEDTPGILDEYRDILRDSARDFRNIEIIDGKRLLPHDRKYFADGVHPNADGMEIIAKNICNFIADKQV